MEFNSQICTTRTQSERLLALGLKKETADMHHYQYTDGGRWNIEPRPSIAGYTNRLVPAWSLHRLIEMLPKEIFDQSKQWHLFLSLCYEDTISYEECDSPQPCYLHFCSSDNIYDNIIETIEWLIKESHFNKEYLEE